MLAEAHASLGLVRLATPRLVLLETAAFWSCEALVHTRRALDDILERHTEYEWRYVEIDSVSLGASVDRSRLWLLGARKARVQENGVSRAAQGTHHWLPQRLEASLASRGDSEKPANASEDACEGVRDDARDGAGKALWCRGLARRKFRIQMTLLNF